MTLWHRVIQNAYPAFLLSPGLHSYFWRFYGVFATIVDHEVLWHIPVALLHSKWPTEPTYPFPPPLHSYFWQIFLNTQYFDAILWHFIWTGLRLHFWPVIKTQYKYRNNSQGQWKNFKSGWAKYIWTVIFDAFIGFLLPWWTTKYFDAFLWHCVIQNGAGRRDFRTTQ